MHPLPQIRSSDGPTRFSRRPWPVVGRLETLSLTQAVPPEERRPFRQRLGAIHGAPTRKWSSTKPTVAVVYAASGRRPGAAACPADHSSHPPEPGKSSTDADRASREPQRPGPNGSRSAATASPVSSLHFCSTYSERVIRISAPNCADQITTPAAVPSGRILDPPTVGRLRLLAFRRTRPATWSDRQGRWLL